MRFPKKLSEKLQKRRETNAFRGLKEALDLVDFSSNDYLGISRSENVFSQTHAYLQERGMLVNGATGSRLLSGNHAMYKTLEQDLCAIHNAESALVFNSGYDANIGFFSSVPQRGDIILYDELIHASIRDGLKMSDATAYKFRHNDMAHLAELLERFRKEDTAGQELYIVTESVFSMDGDCPDIKQMAVLSNQYNALLVVDEAHAVGVFGDSGQGLLQDLGMENEVFARIITFGKALGSHGAAILGSSALKKYLVNFSRSLIYTTGLSPHSVATIQMAYQFLRSNQGLQAIAQLKKNIAYFKKKVAALDLETHFVGSDSAIHCCVVSGNETVKRVAQEVQQKGFDVKPILSPTVPKETERLRFCLHSYNSEKEIDEVLETLRIFVS